MVFKGRSPLCPPLLGKAIKLFFSTSPKTLSLRFDSALVYREAELLASGGGQKALFSEAETSLNSEKNATSYSMDHFPSPQAAEEMSW